LNEGSGYTCLLPVQQSVKSESDLILRYLRSAVEIVIPLSRAYLLGFKARGPTVLNADPPEMVSSEEYD
jgi:hypothetical protein